MEDCCNLFNTGMLVLHPSQDVYRDMLKRIHDLESYHSQQSSFAKAFSS